MELKGKTVLFLGSSVTYGHGGVSFADIMAEQCELKMIKEAVSGTTLADINKDSYVARLKKREISEKVDLFICQLSTNDTRPEITLEQTEAAIREILNYVHQKFNCPIVFYTNPRFENNKYGDLVKLLSSLQKEYHFHILDFWNDDEMTSAINANYKEYMKDAVHPYLVCYRNLWTPKFIYFCNSI